MRAFLLGLLVSSLLLAADDAEVRKLIADLGADDAAVREKATRSLEDLGDRDDSGGVEKQVAAAGSSSSSRGHGVDRSRRSIRPPAR